VRRPVIAGNWKMFKTAGEARAFLEALKPLVANATHCDVVIAPTFTGLAAAAEVAKGSAIIIAAQDGYWEREGAYTGEISMGMIADTGARMVIVGHSERRHYFHETDETVNRKVKAALAAGLTPIMCVGETLKEREDGLTHEVLRRHFEGGVAGLTGADFSRILLAYEPVWAIGTGRTATREVAGEAHEFLRELAAAQFTPERASALRILYGGSVKPENIRDLMTQVEIDGALVGGASLNAQSFASIVNF
jgi:triosephosphate isomerase (TIM)